MGLETIFGTGAISSKLNKVINWGRKYSFFPFPFVTACCGMEFIATWGSHYDVARFGAEFPRFSPRQADLLMVVGTINHKIVPILKRVYDQMCEPKWVVAFGDSPPREDSIATMRRCRALIVSFQLTSTLLAAHHVRKQCWRG